MARRIIWKKLTLLETLDGKLSSFIFTLCLEVFILYMDVSFTHLFNFLFFFSIHGKVYHDMLLRLQTNKYFFPLRFLL